MALSLWSGTAALNPYYADLFSVTRISAHREVTHLSLIFFPKKNPFLYNEHEDIRMRTKDETMIATRPYTISNCLWVRSASK